MSIIPKNWKTYVSEQSNPDTAGCAAHLGAILQAELYDAGGRSSSSENYPSRETSWLKISENPLKI